MLVQVTQDVTCFSATKPSVISIISSYHSIPIMSPRQEPSANICPKTAFLVRLFSGGGGGGYYWRGFVLKNGLADIEGSDIWKEFCVCK